MINDKDIEYNMALYFGLMETKYQNVKEKRMQLEAILFQAASKIQRAFRKFSLKIRTRSAIKLQRWWKKHIQKLSQRIQRVQKFNRFYHGLIISRWIMKKLSRNLLEPMKPKRNQKQRKQVQRKTLQSRITYLFPDYICRRSALFAEMKYIGKYRQFLRDKFQKDWELYEASLQKELWKEINRKWVKVDKARNSKQQRDAKNKAKLIYLTEQDKEIYAEEYVAGKLNKMYEQEHAKLDTTDANLQNNQKQLNLAIMNLEARYIQAMLNQPYS